MMKAAARSPIFCAISGGKTLDDLTSISAETRKVDYAILRFEGLSGADMRTQEPLHELEVPRSHQDQVSERRELARLRIKIDHLQQRLTTARLETERLTGERDSLLRSTSWRLTAPIRKMKTATQIVTREPRRFWALVAHNLRLTWHSTSRSPAPKQRPFGRARQIVASPAGWEYPGVAADPDFSAWTTHRMRYLRKLVAQGTRLISSLSDRPLISVIVPVHDPEVSHLERALQSVEEQIYPHWELVIVDDASKDAAVIRYLQYYAETYAKARLYRLERSAHIAGATNKCIAEAKGDFVVFLDHDDELTPDALLEVARVVADDPTVDAIYSDHDILGEDGTLRCPSFKPSWSPELLLSYMYLGHLKAYRTALVREVSGMRDAFEGAADYDLALRVTERARSIRHIPTVLYHWRAAPGSMARTSSTKPESFESGQRAVEDAVGRRGIRASVDRPCFAERMGLGIYQLRFAGVNTIPVTIIVPTKNKAELLRSCIASIERHTTHQAYRIMIVDNGSDEASALDYLQRTRHRVIRYVDRNGFNFAGIVNAAVAATETEYFVLLNNDTIVISSNWLEEMLGYAVMPGVGAVGAKLLYPGGRIQHAGVILGVHGLTGHAFQGRVDAESSLEYMYFAHVARNYAAVTGACLLTRKRVFSEIGGFDAKNLRVAWNDVDYCLRLYEHGWRVVFTPYAALYHLEAQSRGDKKDPAEIQYMLRRWGHSIDTDPFFNPNLSRLDQECRIRTDPNEKQHFYYRDFRCALIS
jgi:O-antigen biosynthesis protein